MCAGIGTDSRFIDNEGFCVPMQLGTLLNRNARQLPYESTSVGCMQLAPLCIPV